MKIPNAIADNGTGIEIQRERGIMTLRTITEQGDPTSPWADIDIDDLRLAVGAPIKPLWAFRMESSPNPEEPIHLIEAENEGEAAHRFLMMLTRRGLGHRGSTPTIEEINEDIDDGNIVITRTERYIDPSIEDVEDAEGTDPIEAGPWIIKCSDDNDYWIGGEAGWGARDQAVQYDTASEAEQEADEIRAPLEDQLDDGIGIVIEPLDGHAHCPRCHEGPGGQSCGKSVHLALDSIAQLYMAHRNLEGHPELQGAIEARIAEFTEECK